MAITHLKAWHVKFLKIAVGYKIDDKDTTYGFKRTYSYILYPLLNKPGDIKNASINCVYDQYYNSYNI